MHEAPNFRIGLGFDVHPRDESRSLTLAGVSFEGSAGLAAHSDGDVACHALADAMLGAAALGDVGQHFPETDPTIQGISGLDLLARTVGLVAESGFSVWSCDLTLICHHPAISPRRDEMRGCLAEAVGVGTGAVSVKATRPEGLGLSGDGIGCMAVAALTSSAS
jgi:2-C-methyl-D-erythritol 2,4-cyclodiphosphate synthase